MVQFDPDRDHLFMSDQILAVLFGLWSGGRFTPINLVRTKLKSLKVRTKRGRCESALSLNRRFAFFSPFSYFAFNVAYSCWCAHGVWIHMVS